MRFEFTNPTVRVGGYDLSQDVVRIRLHTNEAPDDIPAAREWTASLPDGTITISGVWDVPSPDHDTEAVPARPERDVLQAIDRAVDGLCPCGAEPREGSAYCSYDCEPNIVGAHTDPRGPGFELATPMRWRPDLVSEAPDEGLEPAVPPFRRGRYTAQIFTRIDWDDIHLRLDDGYRFVGLDVAAEFAQDRAALEEAWGRLERELGDQRRLIPAADRPHGRAVPWDETHVWPVIVLDQLRAGLLTPLQAALLCQQAQPPAGRVTHLTTVRDLRAHLDGARTSMVALDEATRAVGEAVRRAFSVPEGMVRQDTDAAEHLMLRAIEARRQRQNNGPPERRRVPRRTDPPRR